MIKPYRFWQRIAQLIAYAYSTLIAGYLILRLMFWDRLWPIALMGDFVPWIFLPIFLLPILGFFLIKKRWFGIVSSVAGICLLGWLHVTYFSPQPANISDSQPTLKVFSLNLGWHHKSPQAVVNLIQEEKPDLICLQEIKEDYAKEVFSKLAALPAPPGARIPCDSQQISHSLFPNVTASRGERTTGTSYYPNEPARCSSL
jgi:endonuclease/exonuclease/phosphatase (EEP) superfamily protein YafD